MNTRRMISHERLYQQERHESEHCDEQEQSHGYEGQDKENLSGKVSSDCDVEWLEEITSPQSTVAGRTQEELASSSGSSSNAAGGFPAASAPVEVTGWRSLGTDGMKSDGKVNLVSDDDEPAQSKDCTRQVRKEGRKENCINILRISL